MAAKNSKANSKQKGYALLEYCAGAAILAGVLVTALGAMGTSMKGVLDGVGRWAVAQVPGSKNVSP